MRINRISFEKGSSVLVSVVIPTIRKDVASLRSITDLLAVSHVNLEIITVHDGGRRLEYRKNRSRARNKGADVATGDILFFLDDDVSFQPDVFERALNIVLTRKKALAGGAFVEPWAGLPYVGTRFLMLRRDGFGDIGGFDESLCAFEDWEFSARALIKGHSMVNCGASLGHHHNRSFGEMLIRNIIREAYGTLAVQKHAAYLRMKLFRWFFPLFIRHPALTNNLLRNGVSRAVVRLMSHYYWGIRKILTALQDRMLTFPRVRK